MALTTLFGSTLLELQTQLARSVTTERGGATVDNFIVVSLRRESFVREHPEGIESGIERFRRDLEEAAAAYISSNGWRVGGTGTLVANILVRAISDELSVQLRRVDRLYTLAIRDDNGSRQVPVRSRELRIGRDHEPRPRDFVGLGDRSRTISREHLILRYRDLSLACVLLGRNPTSVNDVPLGVEPVTLHRGDRIACGTITITVEDL